MSANGNGDDEVPGRELAYRLFAAEYDDASLSYAESDEERAPNYVISPTGARLNRVFAVGTLTEVTSVNDEMVRARVVDPTGAFVVYAGQYQPDELAFLEQTDPPAFVAVTGKARTFQPDDSDQVYTSIRPESIATVDADTRDRWVVSAAEQTIDRIGTYAGAAELEDSAEPRSADSRAAESFETTEPSRDDGSRKAASEPPRDASGEALTDALLEAGVESGLAAGIPLAQDHYGTTPSYLAALRDCALEACEVVAGDRDQVSGLDIAPGATSPEFDATFASLADLDGVDIEALEASAEPKADTDSAPTEPVAAAAGGSGAATDPEDAHSGSAAGTATSDSTDVTGTADIDIESETGTTETEIESEPDTDTAEPELEADASDGDEPTISDDTDEPAISDESDTAGGAAETTASESAADPEPINADAGSDSETLETESAETTANAVEETDDSAESASDEAGDDELDDFGAGDVDDSMYEMDEEEREQLEEEFGAEFTTGSEVEVPGEADIDVPDSEDVEAGEPAGESASSEDEPAANDETAGAQAADSDDDLGAPPESGLEAEDKSEPESGADEPATDEESDADDSEAEPADDVDLEAYVVETMEELDDGDGADRTTVIEEVAADTGASADDVENAIQDALMGGQCYEPDDETLKAI